LLPAWNLHLPKRESGAVYCDLVLESLSVRVAKEVETIKRMEERQEDVQRRFCIAWKLITVAFEDGRLHEGY